MEGSNLSGFVERPKYVCSLGGAVGTISALPRTVPILHAATGCGGNIATSLNQAAGYRGSGYCNGQALPSTNTSEREIVFGGEARLNEQIENTIKLVEGDLYFVITGCMVEMIGDNIFDCIKNHNTKEIKVIGAETGGFHGNYYKGYEIVLKTLFKDFVEPQAHKDPQLINLFGIVPLQDVFWQGNIAIIKEMLAKLGYRVNSFFGYGETLDNLRTAAAASMNIVVSDTFGVEAAQVFEEVHGVPYIKAPFPIGDHGSSLFLRTVGDALGIDRVFVEKVIKEEQAYYYGYLERIADVYSDLDLQRYAVIIGDSNYTQALTRFLADDLGWLPELVVVNDFLDENQKTLVETRFRDYESGINPQVIFDTNASNIRKHVTQHWGKSQGQRYFEGFNPGFVLGSAIDRDLAESLGVPQLSVTYPISNRVVMDRGYTGYTGALRLTEDILSILISGR
jgi:nitrogenase molybdenum-iron protein beta chain